MSSTFLFWNWRIRLNLCPGWDPKIVHWGSSPTPNSFHPIQIVFFSSVRLWDRFPWLVLLFPSNIPFILRDCWQLSDRRSWKNCQQVQSGKRIQFMVHFWHKVFTRASRKLSGNANRLTAEEHTLRWQLHRNHLLLACRVLSDDWYESCSLWQLEMLQWKDTHFNSNVRFPKKQFQTTWPLRSKPWL
jgi:hypothetical protein